MAYIFPNSPIGLLPPEVLRVFRFLKTLPDDVVIWHRLTPWEKDAPDFFILNRQQQGLLIKVSISTPESTRPAAQLLLIEDERHILGEHETKIINKFLEQLCSGQENFIGALSEIIIFPNIPERQLRESFGDSKQIWLGREDIQQEAQLRWKNYFSCRPLNVLEIEHIRAAFTPEVVVPKGISTRSVSKRQLEAGLTHHLLDYNQEAVLKTDLHLPDESQDLARDFSINLVNGVAGSGKTLILLFRLRLLVNLYPKKNYLVLTHNRPLIHDMQSRSYKLEPQLPDQAEWCTFLQWCKKYWPAKPEWVNPSGYERRKGLIRQAWLNGLDKTDV
jgi:hypothetical protein